MIKPTIGRVVWFWADNVACYDENAQPNAALVTYVYGDDCVSLVVFDKNGDGKARPVISLWQGEGPRPSGPHCEWMPYQKGQAAKQETSNDLEAKVAALASELAGMRNFIAVLAKDIAERQSAKGAGLPPPPAAKQIGEDPNKDGTGVG